MFLLFLNWLFLGFFLGVYGVFLENRTDLISGFDTLVGLFFVPDKGVRVEVLLGFDLIHNR